MHFEAQYEFEIPTNLYEVCGDIESNPGPGSNRTVRVPYSDIRGRRVNLDVLSMAGSDCNVLVCTESKVTDRSHHSELRIPGFGCPQQRLRNSTPTMPMGAMALYVTEGFRYFRQSKLVCSCHESCVVFATG